MKKLNLLSIILLLALFTGCGETPKNTKKQTAEKVAPPVVKPDLPEWLSFVDSDYASLDNLALGSEKAQAAQKAEVSLNRPLEVKLKKSGISFRLIPAGSFIMGSKKGHFLEKAVHGVTLTESFYCGKFTITQAEWKKVMGSLPKRYKAIRAILNDQLPMIEVSWNDCMAYLRQVEKFEGMPKNSLHLLTEAQWEYSCRAGTKTEFYFGDSVTSKYINFNGKKPFGDAAIGPFVNKILPGGQYPANAFGLYDMHGNVGQWCADSCAGLRAKAETYKDDIVDPISKKGTNRVYRGSGYRVSSFYNRSSSRMGVLPNRTYANVGFRIALNVKSLKP